MAISQQVTVLESALWPQGDVRDPLGAWGGRLGVSGDATGADVRVQFQVPADKRAAYLYTVYGASVVVIAGAHAASNVSARILTNWPNIDNDAGIQGYSTVIGRSMTDLGGPSIFPISAPDDPLLDPNSRYILCFDPSNLTAGPMDLLEVKIQTNTDGNAWSFEAYGYFWDRSVLNAPGGPRHPGAS